MCNKSQQNFINLNCNFFRACNILKKYYLNKILNLQKRTLKNMHTINIQYLEALQVTSD